MEGGTRWTGTRGGSDIPPLDALTGERAARGPHHRWNSVSPAAPFLPHLEHLECSHQPHIQGRGAKKRTQRAG